MPCPFCDRIAGGSVILERPQAVAFADAYPLSRGHMLIVPRRHVASVFDLDRNEQVAVWTLAAEVRDLLRAEHGADGFNLGVNDGTAAGQTILHAHVHVIPRYAGDVGDPRGGIRLILPEKAAYWDHSP